MSRADARDTGTVLLIRGGDGAALLIRGGGALGVETPAHEEGREAVGRKMGWSGAVRKAGWIGAERRVTEGWKREQRRECRRINVSAQGRRRAWGGILLC